VADFRVIFLAHRTAPDEFSVPRKTSGLQLSAPVIASLSVFLYRFSAVASLIVRDLDDRVVEALKALAARHKRSAEAEHRALLERALLKPRRKTFSQALKAMPDVGLDTDFERVEDEGSKHVFD
jgi:plasmid stability protein